MLNISYLSCVKTQQKTGLNIFTDKLAMGLIKEPINVDFSNESMPWTEKELSDFRQLMLEIKAKNATREKGFITKRKNVHSLK